MNVISDIKPQQDRSRKSLEKIVAAAEFVIRRDGIEAFSMSSIAEAAGISVGGIYRRVSDKNGLFKIIKANVLDMILTTTRKRLKGPFATADSVLDAYIEALVAIFSRDTKLHRALFYQGNLQPELQVSGMQGRQGLLDILSEAIGKVEPTWDRYRSELRFAGDMIASSVTSQLIYYKDDEIDWVRFSSYLRIATSAYIEKIVK